MELPLAVGLLETWLNVVTDQLPMLNDITMAQKIWLNYFLVRNQILYNICIIMIEICLYRIFGYCYHVPELTVHGTSGDVSCHAGVDVSWEELCLDSSLIFPEHGLPFRDYIVQVAYL